MVIDVTEEQSLKALSLIDVTDDGMSTDARVTATTAADDLTDDGS